MRLRFIVCLIVLAVALLQVNRIVASDTVQSDANTSPLAVLTGNDSHVRKQAFLRITSATDWKKAWLDHLGMNEDTIYRPAMEVDFTRCEVVAIFEGESINRCGLRVDSVNESGDEVSVRLNDISYQTASSGKEDKGDRVSPYAFIVLPKTDKAIVLENNVQQYLGQPPQWKEVARLKLGKP